MLFLGSEDRELLTSHLIPDEPAEEKPVDPKTPKFIGSARFSIAIFSFFSLGIIYNTQVNLSMAIVCMTGTHDSDNITNSNHIEVSILKI